MEEILQNTYIAYTRIVWNSMLFCYTVTGRHCKAWSPFTSPRRSVDGTGNKGSGMNAISKIKSKGFLKWGIHFTCVTLIFKTHHEIFIVFQHVIEMDGTCASVVIKILFSHKL